MIASTPSHLFRADLQIRIRIAGCPESGLSALDWRRARGLPERLDNRHDISLSGEISEDAFRQLIAAGYCAIKHTDGSQTVSVTDLRQEYSPSASYGHCATIPVAAEDDAVTLACRARLACAREQRRSDLGASKLERERASLVERIAEIDRVLAETE